MSGRTKVNNTKINPWLYKSNGLKLSEKFLMLPPELLEEEAFQKLTYGARFFYIVLCVHKETDIQRTCLYNALKEYNEVCGIGLSEFDIKNESMPNKKTKLTKGYFVAPTKQLEAYGLKKSYVTKLKAELECNGFIETVYAKKGRYCGWENNVTVYKFSNKWKIDKVKNSVHDNEQHSTQ